MKKFILLMVLTTPVLANEPSSFQQVKDWGMSWVNDCEQRVKNISFYCMNPNQTEFKDCANPKFIEAGCSHYYTPHQWMPIYNMDGDVIGKEWH